MFHTKSKNTELLINQHAISGIDNVNSGSCNAKFSYLEDLADILSNGKALRTKVDGLAIKLSQLDRYGLTISDVLKVTTFDIIIDAEYDRLDKCVIEWIKADIIKIQDLQRLVITVQVRRKDAEQQLKALSRLSKEGIKVVLVAGHPSYIKDQVTAEEKLSHRFLRLYRTYKIYKLGIGSKMKDELHHLDLNLSNNNIMELQGYDKLKGSNLWSYYAGRQLSETASDYLTRRGTKGNFICRSIEDLIKLSTRHQLIVFVDECCSLQFLVKIAFLNQILII